MADQVVKVFLVDDAYVELQDAYVDKEKDLRAEVFQQLKQLCKSAKMTKVNKTLVVNLKKINDETNERELKQESLQIGKDVDLDKYEVKFDPNWIPEKMDKNSIEVFKMKVGDNTWKYLQLFYQIYCARIDKYNSSLTSEERKKDKADLPKCFEQVIHEQLLGSLMQLIQKQIDKEFEEEFQELQKEEEDKKPKAGSRDKKKKH